MKQTRTITHTDHTDIETLINGVWAVTSCNVILQTKEDAMTIWNKTKSHYETKPVRDNHNYQWVKCHNCKLPYVIVDGKAPVSCDNCGVLHDAEQVELCSAIVADCTEQVARFTSSIAGAYIVDGEHPVTEAQQIERAIDATLHVEDLERRNEFPSYDELIKGAKFTDKHRADLHNWWNAKYSRG
jgi:hypothetical protein